jgi:O-antigen ligase
MVHDAILSEESEVTQLQFLVFVAVQLMLLFVGAYFDAVQFLPPLLAGILFFLWSLYRPRVWIFTVILLYSIILQRSEGITIWEVLFAAYCFGGIALWLLLRIQQNIVVIEHSADRFLVVFLLLCVLSIVPALLNGADAVRWSRELMIFYAYLLFFPVRQAIVRHKALPWIGLGFLILSLSIAVNNFLKYKTAASSAVYLWELLSGRQTANEPLFVTSILIGMALFLFVRSTSARAVILALVSFFALALALTFSRGYWIGLFVGIAVLFVLFKGKERWRLSVALLMLASVAAIVLLVVFRSMGLAILGSMADRLGAKSLSPVLDVSLQSRISETRSVIQTIFTNPILGSGLGVYFKFPDPISKTMYETWYVHNGYLFLWFKVGLAGLMCYLLAYGAMLRDAYKLFKEQQGTFESHLLAGVIAVLAAMSVISLTSPQFITRDSILIISLCWGVIGAFRLKRQDERQAE